jgi:hypothetical protein
MPRSRAGAGFQVAVESRQTDSQLPNPQLAVLHCCQRDPLTREMLKACSSLLPTTSRQTTWRAPPDWGRDGPIFF